MVKSMKSLNDALETVKEALTGVSDNVGMYEANDGTITHIIFAPDSEASQSSEDNKKEIQTIQGTLDLYAKKKDISLFDSIQESLNDAGVSFYLNSVQYEDNDKNDFIHYEWIFEVS